MDHDHIILEQLRNKLSDCYRLGGGLSESYCELVPLIDGLGDVVHRYCSGVRPIRQLDAHSKIVTYCRDRGLDPNDLANYTQGYATLDKET